MRKGVREKVTEMGFKCFIITEWFNLLILRFLLLPYLPSLGYIPNMALLPDIPVLWYNIINNLGAILLPTIGNIYKGLIT